MTTVPVPHRVVGRRQETGDTVTLRLEPVDTALPDFLPGQFAMVHCFGRGEIPVSVSSVQATGGLAHTVRSVGAVSDGLCAAGVGDIVGIRGPYGTSWELQRARGRDVLVVAGGIGLAPLRPLILGALAEPAAYRRVNVLIGARQRPRGPGARDRRHRAPRRGGGAARSRAAPTGPRRPAAGPGTKGGRALRTGLGRPGGP
jgi:NAD(P)H-flavin reductase